VTVWPPTDETTAGEMAVIKPHANAFASLGSHDVPRVVRGDGVASSAGSDS
jgi:hypothetical protein